MKSTIGVAQPALTIVALKRMEIALPTLPMQRRIAGILSGYDKLMEVCRRRIRSLEEMARALYREWFVEFRFPEHEKVPRVDSALGSIPKGWEVTKLGNILELNYGKALRQDQRRDGCVPVFGSSGIVGYHDECLARGPGIVVGRKGNVGSVFWCDEDFFVIDTAYFVSSSLPLRFLFYDLQTKNFINNDAAVPGLSRHQAYALETMVPPADLLSRFCRFADGFEGQASLFRRQVENLRHTRDLLLTRLLSGQVPLDIPEDEADPAEPEDVPFDLLPRTNGYRSATTEPRPASRAFPDTRSESGDDDGPPRIDDTERTAVLQKIRQVFSEGRPRTRDAAIGDVARALGYQRTGARIHEILHTDLLTAVRRGILENTGGELRLCARSIADYDRDFLKQQFLAAIGRTWICREDAIRQFCHWLGFARTGAIIEDIARSLINGLLREGRLEAEGAEMIRRV